MSMDICKQPQFDVPINVDPLNFEKESPNMLENFQK